MAAVRRPLYAHLFLVFLAGVGSACSAGTEGLEDAGPISCTTNDQCPADAWCQAGTCTPGSGNECTSDEACGPDRTCVIVTDCGAARCSGNTCQPKPCTTHDECEGVCLDGHCTPAPTCADGGACPTGLYCVEGVCTPPEEVTCNDDQDCPEEGQRCVASACVIPTPCSTSAECPESLRCIRGACDDPCTTADECGQPAAFYRCDEPTGECQQRCLQSGQCPEQQICQQGLCVPAECQSDADCDLAANEACEGEEDGHGQCLEFTPCGAQGECPLGTTCNPTTQRCDPLPGCRTDRDCAAGEYCDRGYCEATTTCATDPCPEGQSCVAEVCVPFTCRGPADCTVPGELCLSGRCQVPPNPDFVVEVRIITPAGTVRPGTTYTFVALALDQAGRVVPGVNFDWTTTSSAVATIDASGVATGGPTPGTTQIRASVDTAAGRITSAPVALRNLAPLPAGRARITVVRASTGAPISGAAVEIHGPGAFTQAGTTNTQGQVELTGVPNGALTVTAGHADYDYLTIIGVTGRDLLLPLSAATRPDRVAGARGTVDLSLVSTQGAISASLSGASFASPLLGYEVGRLFGEELFQVEVPMLGPIPIPAANTLSAELMGFPLDLKDTWYVRADAGNRALFSFGGKIELGPNGLDPTNLGNVLTAILPFYQRFDHAVRPFVPLLALPLAADTPDVDGDGDTSELAPDWAGFGAFAMTPATPQNLRYELAVDNLPFVSGGNANTLVVVAGVVLPGLGFVPLGLDGQSDQQGNGIIERFVSKMAPPHDGLEAGDYAVLATAVRVETVGFPGAGSSRLWVGPNFPTTVDLDDGWLDAPVDASYATAARELALPLELGVDLYHVVFSAPTGAWHVYLDAPSAEVATLPAAPAGLVDRTVDAAVAFDGVDLVPGAGVTGIFDAAAGGTLALDRATRGFARAVAP